MLDVRKAPDRAEILKYCGNPCQVAGTRHVTLNEGVGRGTSAIDVQTGSGFAYTIVPDRGLDISLASCQGVNLVYLTRSMEAHPAYYDSQGDGWLRTFMGGLLTTCGPAHLGPPCVDGGEALGLHGRFNGTPARSVCDRTSFERGEILVTGVVEDCAPFGDKLVIERTIRSEMGTDAVTVEDRARNIGSRPSPLTMLYHVNFGYPLLSEDSRIFVQSASCEPYDDYSGQYMGDLFRVARPSGANREKNYLHRFSPGRNTAVAGVWNPGLLGGLAAYVRFHPAELPYLTQWKLEDEIDYVVALEPSNVPCESRNVLREKGLLETLPPGGERRFHVEIGVLRSNREIEELLATL